MKSKSYFEACHGHVFDWNEFLQRDYYNSTDLWVAKIMAGSWVTCACGNQCDVIPRDGNGVPLDGQLQLLGLEFCGLISRWRISSDDYYRFKAIECLKRIEERSTLLISRITSKSCDTSFAQLRT